MVIHRPHPETETGRTTVREIVGFLKKTGVIMIEYKGYIGAVEFDDSVGCLHGRVTNSGDYSIVTFEATDMEGIQREFRRSIDEYLACCEEYGIEP